VPSGPPPETSSPGALLALAGLSQVSPTCSTTSVDGICGSFWGPVGPRLFALR